MKSTNLNLALCWAHSVQVFDHLIQCSALTIHFKASNEKTPGSRGGSGGLCCFFSRSFRARWPWWPWWPAVVGGGG